MSDETQAQQPALPLRRNSEFEPSLEDSSVKWQVERNAPPSEAASTDALPSKKAPRKRATAASKATAEKVGEDTPQAKPARSPRKRGERAVLPEPASQADHAAEDIENSIEGSAVRVRESVDQQAQSMAEAAGGLFSSPSARRAAPRQSVFSPIGHAASGLQAWLLNLAESRKASITERAEAPATSGAASGARGPGSVGGDVSNVVPAAVARRFLKVEQDYYFLDKTPAFSDRGNKLATRGAHPDVVRSLVEIAKARRWESITVKGTTQFRRSAWLEAAQQGMTVVGYQPTPLDLAELANFPAKNSVERSLVRDKEYPTQQQGAGAMQGGSGVPHEPVPTLTDKRMAKQSSEANPELLKKAKTFAKNKPAFVVKKYPDLTWAYGVVEAAKTFAVERLPEAAREYFVEIARKHVLQKIVAGEAVKGPQIYIEPSKTMEKDGRMPTSGAPARNMGEARHTEEKTEER